MKVIIAGSRAITDYSAVIEAIRLSGFDITEIVSGTADGVDLLGEAYGEANKIPVKRFPADWHSQPRRGGYIRNQQMANYADALIAVWDGKSSGTSHMIAIARAKGMKVFVHHVNVSVSNSPMF